MRALPHAAFTAALLVSACGGKPPATLGPDADTIPTTLSEVTAGAWLGGNRWALLAVPDERVVIADGATHAVTPLGGPKELRNPATLFRGGDTLYVGDWGLRRTSRWTLGGRFAGAEGVSDAVRGVLPRALDGAGHFYFEIAPRPAADGRGNRDSADRLSARPTRSRGWRRSTSPRLRAVPATGSSAACSAAPTNGVRCRTARCGWDGCTTIGSTGAIPRGNGSAASRCPTGCSR